MHRLGRLLSQASLPQSLLKRSCTAAAYRVAGQLCCGRGGGLENRQGNARLVNEVEGERGEKKKRAEAKKHKHNSRTLSGGTKLRAASQARVSPSKQVNTQRKVARKLEETKQVQCLGKKYKSWISPKCLIDQRG